MNNEQKELTLEDVRKMTDEQRTNITPEQKAMLMEQKKRKERIRCVDFINNESFSEFLKLNGYEIVGYDHNRYNFEEWCIHFSRFGGYEKAYRSTNWGLILLGPQSEWGENVDDFTCKDIAKNPFVKYLDWGLTEFKVYSIVNNIDADGWGSDEALYCGNLEKDLSDEWVEFWALRDEDYAKYVLEECDNVRNRTPEDIEHYNNLLAKRIAELQAEHVERVDQANKKLARYNKIQQIIKNTQNKQIKYNN
ncbi:MAG: hypothetical protein IJA72_03840 [Clostridia bacterium]|nr:hypothetical protein [Clostridia bacterium]